ncbi:Uncharacterised protein [Yersinia pekkanenii]|uniref:Uncharacterized protein n=1 Tax=Yersinia pekkanenii TaxID=1288385 RepID=A0A0T9Q9Q7_9GAMM|nr:Uncharacterised protein [Yersinia pekkanenii]
MGGAQVAAVTVENDGSGGDVKWTAAYIGSNGGGTGEGTSGQGGGIDAVATLSGGSHAAQRGIKGYSLTGDRIIAAVPQGKGDHRGIAAIGLNSEWGGFQSGVGGAQFLRINLNKCCRPIR